MDKYIYYMHTIYGGSMHIEIKVRQIRKEKGISLNNLSDLTGISKGYLSKIERNEVQLSLYMAIRISIALKIDIKDLYKIIN